MVSVVSQSAVSSSVIYLSAIQLIIILLEPKILVNFQFSWFLFSESIYQTSTKDTHAIQLGGLCQPTWCIQFGQCLEDLSFIFFFLII